MSVPGLNFDLPQDGTNLTVAQLKQILTYHEIELPPRKVRKQQYVSLYNNHILPLYFNDESEESEEELEEPIEKKEELSEEEEVEELEPVVPMSSRRRATPKREINTPKRTFNLRRRSATPRDGRIGLGEGIGEVEIKKRFSQTPKRRSLSPAPEEIVEEVMEAVEEIEDMEEEFPETELPDLPDIETMEDQLPVYDDSDEETDDEEHKGKSVCFTLLVTFLLLGLATFYILPAFYPFCEQMEGESWLIKCNKCPEHAICEDLRLSACQEGYVKRFDILERHVVCKALPIKEEKPEPVVKESIPLKTRLLNCALTKKSICLYKRVVNFDYSIIFSNIYARVTFASFVFIVALIKYFAAAKRKGLLVSEMKFKIDILLEDMRKIDHNVTQQTILLDLFGNTYSNSHIKLFKHVVSKYYRTSKDKGVGGIPTAFITHKRR
ncbi:hypothetical protein PCE1_003385 [Barthelona sp. PCE]